jgi:hypothetical protein
MLNKIITPGQNHYVVPCRPKSILDQRKLGSRSVLTYLLEKVGSKYAYYRGDKNIRYNISSGEIEGKHTSTEWEPIHPPHLIFGSIADARACLLRDELAEVIRDFVHLRSDTRFDAVPLEVLTSFVNNLSEQEEKALSVVKDFPPISSFQDHPVLKGEDVQRIYFYDRSFYLADRQKLRPVEILKLRYANLGDPFRQFARLDYRLPGVKGDKTESVDISNRDAARLAFLFSEEGNPLTVESDLQSSREFASYWEDLAVLE